MPTSTSEAPGSATGEKRCVKGLWKAHVTAQRVLAAIVRLQASVQLRHKVLEVIKEYAPGTRDVKQVRVQHKMKSWHCYNDVLPGQLLYVAYCVQVQGQHNCFVAAACGCHGLAQICVKTQQYAHDDKL
jgi:hypothetical protein